jgi:hypothetical protein
MASVKAGIVMMLAAAVGSFAGAADKEESKQAAPGAQVVKSEAVSAAWAPAIKPKALSNNVHKGLKWLADHQHESGGWGQGEESQHMGNSMAHMIDQPNAADTCAAALAMIRSGSTPAKGPYSQNIRKAVDFVMGQVEAADAESLFITNVRNTRLQMKLGTYIDTFLASLLFAEVNGKMPDAASQKRLDGAFEKVMDKIERNQRTDGTFGETGWANTLSYSLASKGINRAVQSGRPVSEPVREKMEGYAQAQYDESSGRFSGAGSAGVDLYSSSANLSVMRDNDNTNKELKKQAEQKRASARTDEERAEAEKTIARINRNEDQLQSAQQSVVKKLGDARFIAGFGSNGGEEFLSYMNIGESLVVSGGDAWTAWDKKITENLNEIQNADGSWTGHHCITGRTFCTSAALLVLMTDRAPVPMSAKFRRQ